MDASNKSFNQLGQNDLTGHQVISSFISNPVLLLHTFDSLCLTDSRCYSLSLMLRFVSCFFNPFPLEGLFYSFAFFQAFLLFIVLSLIFNFSCSLFDYGGFSLMLFSFFISFLFVFGFKCLLILLCHFMLACVSVSFLFSGVPFTYFLSFSECFSWLLCRIILLHKYCQQFSCVSGWV